MVCTASTREGTVTMADSEIVTVEQLHPGDRITEVETPAGPYMTFVTHNGTDMNVLHDDDDTPVTVHAYGSQPVRRAVGCAAVTR
jgi:hypothetical protein